MGPFTPLFSSGVPVAVMCCKVSSPEEYVLFGFTVALQEIGYVCNIFAFGVLFFFLLPSALSFLLRLWGWERWLFDPTFLLWTDFDDCCLLAVFPFSFTGMTLAQEALLRHRLQGVASPGVFGRFPGFGFFGSVCVPASTAFLFVFLSALPCLVFSSLGWVGACLAFLLFLPPPPPLPPFCLSLASCIYSSN